MSINRQLRLGVRLATIAFPLLLTVTACSGSAPPRAGAGAGADGPGLAGLTSALGLHAQPAIGPLPVVTGPNSLQLPLDPYYLGSDQQLRIFEAMRAAEQACIHRFLPRVSLGSFGMVTPWIPTTEPVAYLALTQAARYGYQDPVAMALQTQTSPLRGTTLAVAQEVDLGTVPTVSGLPVPRGGCSAVGTAAVEKGITLTLIPRGTGRLGTVGGDADLIDQPVTQNDSRVQAVNAKWSGCMAARGYQYPSLLYALNDQRWAPRLRNANGSVNSITATEINVATADVTCRAQVNLYAVYWAVAAAYQREWLASPQNMALAQAQQEADQVMLTRTDRILGG